MELFDLRSHARPIPSAETETDQITFCKVRYGLIVTIVTALLFLHRSRMHEDPRLKKAYLRLSLARSPQKHHPPLHRGGLPTTSVEGTFTSAAPPASRPLLSPPPSLPGQQEFSQPSTSAWRPSAPRRTSPALSPRGRTSFQRSLAC